jgi:TonB family protein
MNAPESDVRLSEPPSPADLPDFLIHTHDPDRTWRGGVASIGSLILHVVAVVVYLLIPVTPLRDPADAAAVRPLDVSKAVPLVTPPDLLTQKDANTGQVSKQIDLPALAAKPEVKPQAPAFRPPPGARQAPANPAPQIAEAPALEQPKVAASLPPGLGSGQTPGPPPPAPPPPPVAKPKLAFETPGAQTGAAAQKGLIQAPKNSVDEAMRGAMKSPRGGLIVGDGGDGSILGTPGNPSAPGRAGSQLELLSDPMGVDFKPYLLRVLAAVKRNWFAVMPESARMGQRGRTVIQFSIAKNGSVPKLVIHAPSGAEALDRAAVAGISASNPFPPLPDDYRGNVIRLELVFSYNQLGGSGIR